MPETRPLRQPSVPATILRPPVISDAWLVAAKLSRPEVPPGHVERTRLHAALDAGTTGLVTLVTGGAGWGKTMLVASWAARASRSRPIAWLTLDADDDEPGAFWTYVLAALRASGAVGPENTLASLDPVGGLSTDTLRQIQVGLSQLSREVVLVLDDVSEIRSEEVHDQITRLFRHESPLRLVLVTRVEPPLPLHRLRVSGDLAEVRADELAFTADEAAELLVRQGLGVDHTDLAQLLERTDGWAAGLRLAAMFLKRPGARPVDFGGSDRAVTDYLLGEVVAGQSPQTWQFLLRTSLVSRICGDLADTLTGQGHGQRTLDVLERDNTFVTALGPERLWYRYHPLLTEMLRRQLQLERPEGIVELHERAARWFLSHERPIDAVRHAVAARNWPLAGTIVTHGAFPRLQTTDRRALAATLAQIPTAELGRTAELQLCAASLRLVEGRYAEIAPHLVVARSMIDDDVDAADPSTEIALSLFEGVAARARGSARAAVAAADSALRTLDQHGSAVPLAPAYRAVALNFRGLGLLWQGESEEATRVLRAAVVASGSAGIELTLVNSLGHLGLAAAVRGRLGEATDWAGQCRDLAEARGWADLTQAATGYLTLALVAVARDDLGEAERMLAFALESQRGESEPLVVLALQLAQAAIDTARGRFDAARAELDRVRAALDPADGPMLIQRWLAWTEARVELAAGTHAALRSRLESIDTARRSDDERLVLAQMRLADGEVQGLDELLAPVLRQRRDLHLAVRAWVVKALAADRLRLDDEALGALGIGMSQAAPEHLVSPFSGPGTERLQSLLERTVLLGTAQAGFAGTLLGRLEAAPSPGTSVETVTERERTVLRFLATMLSNEEIAEQMYLSPNTVKVHLRHVYRKLDVTSRRAAVRRARELRLLEEDSSS